MNADERKKMLNELIKTKNPSRTGIPIPYHDNIMTCNAYDIPLEYLVYNKYNGRIGSMVEAHERYKGELDPEKQDDRALIEQFLWESSEEANKRTKARLLKEHQQKHGIVTADGVIIDGNRRACILNQLMRDESIPFNDKAHCQFFTAIILPEDADKKSVMALETTYQMGEDAKVDYNPIEKYLKCRKLKENGFVDKDIADMMGIGTGEVKKMLSTLELMDEYLEEYGYDGIYTLIGKHEDSFLKLDAALKKYYDHKSPSMWEYDVDSDLTDLKLISFDYIRAGIEQEPFRDIISVPNKKNTATSFFSKKKLWETFRDEHFKITQDKDIKEESVKDIIGKNPPDITRALNDRDRTWRQGVEELLRANFEIAKDNLNNYVNEGQPLRQLKKACDALDIVDINQDKFDKEEEIKKYVIRLQEYVDMFKEILKLGT